MYDISSKIDFYIELDTQIFEGKKCPQTKRSALLSVTLTKSDTSSLTNTR